MVDYLKDYRHIEIQLDAAAMKKDVGVDPDTLVTKNLHGISLRSALKLLLDELQLKYVIHNDVLLITSPAKAESEELMTTKVYPVSDLALPIRMGGFYGGMGGPLSMRWRTPSQNELEMELRTKREQLKRELENIGAGDEQTMQARVQLAVSVYAEFQRQFQAMRSEHRLAVARLAEAKKMLQDAATAEIPETEVVLLLNNNPEYRMLKDRVAMLEALKKPHERLTGVKPTIGMAWTETEWKALRAQLKALEQRSSDLVRGRRVGLEEEIRRLESQIEISIGQMAAFEKEVERKGQDADSVGRSSIATKMAADEVENIEHILHAVNAERERLGTAIRSGARTQLANLVGTVGSECDILASTALSTSAMVTMAWRTRDNAEILPWILPGCDRQVPTYQPPVFSNNRAVFYDLVSYAPAMHTDLADAVAVLEAEAPADAAAARPGKIDDRARRLIQRARGAGWQTATIADPQGKTPLTVAFDGTGRYRYERTTSAGLREQVVCDGASLWHLYPELGIGARRTLSRFHRRDFARLVPWALPPVEDLARDADLVMVDQRTVAIVPEGEKREKGREGRKGERQKGRGTRTAGRGERERGTFAPASSSPPTAGWPNGSWSRCPRARFAPARATGWTGWWNSSFMRRTRQAGRLHYKRRTQAGRPHHNGRSSFAPCGVPELKPSADLVVLPLPLRSRQKVYGARENLLE